MRRKPIRLLIWLMALLCAIWITAAWHPPSLTLSKKPTRTPKLSKKSRSNLAQARVEGRRYVDILIAAVPGRGAAVAQQAIQLGGEVRYRDNEVDYLRVRLPIVRADDFLQAELIQAVAIDPNNVDVMDFAVASSTRQVSAANRIAQPSQETQTETSVSQALEPDSKKWPPQPAKLSDYPLNHPYSPLKDMDGVDFLAEHPTFDGRGVTIAMLDGNLDLLLPEFQTAFALDGTPIPKVADFFNVTDCSYAEVAPRTGTACVNMAEQVEAQDGHFTLSFQLFQTPHDGVFRIGFFDARRVMSHYSKQELADIFSQAGTDGLFAILWDEQAQKVWVDTNGNRSFADEKAMADYVKQQDVGVFGKDNPSTAVRESIGFTVQTNSQSKFVSLNLGVQQHATSVIGSVIANQQRKGRLQGIAPGSRIVSICSSDPFRWNEHVEGLIAAFKHAQVDLVVVEAHISEEVWWIVAERLITRYDKLFFCPGGNGPGLGFVGIAPATGVTVGAYQSRESYRVNNGIIPERYDNLHWGGLAHGPSRDGGLKPDLLAPTMTLSTDLGFREGYTKPGLFQLPPGYGITGGTSAAAPMAAGAAALVLSAAKQTGVKCDAAKLKAALVNSARYISTLKANEQGNGLLQVKETYELLKRLGHTPLIKITSQAPVKTRLRPVMPVLNEGVGLYEREGWTLGDKKTRIITLTRTTGPAGPMTFNIGWQGNDSTFSSADSVVLPLNQPVEVPVEISIKEAGAHSAILTLDHPAVPGHVYRVLNTVVAPLKFTRENNYTITTEISLHEPEDRGVFIEVPLGVGALSLSGASKDDKVMMDLISPSLVDINYYFSSQVSAPEAGVWEVNITVNRDSFFRPYDPNRQQPLKPSKVKLRVSLAGVDTAADKLPVATVTARGNLDLPVILTNRFASMSVYVAPTSLGSVFQTKRQIAQGEQQVYEVIVPKGAASLRTRVSDVTDSKSDLDIYFFDCTSSKKCEGRDSATTVGPNGEVEVLNPAPGKWKIVVDGYSVPSGKTSYTYLDVYTHPKFGSVSVTDTPEKRSSGETWSTTAHIWIASVPEGSRTLEAIVNVKSSDIKDSSGNPALLGMQEIPLRPMVGRTSTDVRPQSIR